MGDISTKELRRYKYEVQNSLAEHITQVKKDFKNYTGVEIMDIDFEIVRSQTLGGSRSCIVSRVNFNLDI